MHYKNGREAKAGDRVVDLGSGQGGVIYDLNPGTDTCNGRLAPTNANDPWVTIGNCVLLEDVQKADLAPTPLVVPPVEPAPTAEPSPATPAS